MTVMTVFAREPHTLQDQAGFAEFKSSRAQGQRVALFCGAGVSIPYGLPGWIAFLTNLFNAAIEELAEGKLGAQKRLKLASAYVGLFGGGPLIAARQVKAVLKTDLIEHVRSALYADYNESEPPTPLVDVLARAIVQLGDKRPREIVTYNYDDILERALREQNMLVRVVIRGIDLAKPTADVSATIYHVHGYVPYHEADPPSEDIILAEDTYHWLTHHPYGWRNRIQLDLLSRCCVLMLGISLTDPNVRRLLELAHRDCGRYHFLIKKRESENDLLERTKKVGHTGLNQAALAELLGLSELLEERVADDLGVKIIYVEEWDQLPVLLEQLFDLADD